MYQTEPAKIIDLSPYLKQSCPDREDRRRALAHTLLALWTQYLSLATLVLYGLLRLLACPQVPPGAYSGPLALLWPLSYLLLLVSYIADKVLWREEDGAFT